MTRKVEIPEGLNPRFPSYQGYLMYNQLMEIAEGDVEKKSEDFLFKQIRENAETEYGKKHNFGEIKTLEDFKRMVPISAYDDYAEAIERMTRGETNVLTSEPVVYYAKSSGSMDNPKNIPVTERELQLYGSAVGALAQFVCDHESRRRRGVPASLTGKRFITSVVSMDSVEDGTPRGPLSSAIYFSKKDNLARSLPWPIEVTFPEGRAMDLKYLRAFYGLKERGVTQMSAPFITALTDTFHYMSANWETLVDDIEKGVLNPGVDIDPEMRERFQADLEPDPERARELRRIFSDASEPAVAKRVWPGLESVSGGAGGSFAPYRRKIREYIGDVPIYSSAYCASEGPIGVSTQFNDVKYLLLPHVSFFEFVPAHEEVTDFDQTRTLNVDELREGGEYEIILTNPSGLYRYAIGDVIKVVGFVGNIPEVEFRYRKKQMINLAGEKTNESHLTWVINEIQRETQTMINDYSVYADTGNLPGRYVMFMEPARRVPRSEWKRFREIGDEKMGVANSSYGSKVRDALLNPMEVVFVQPETYYLYRDFQVLKGTSENQLKPVRVIDTPRKEKFFFALIDNEE